MTFDDLVAQQVQQNAALNKLTGAVNDLLVTIQRDAARRRWQPFCGRGKQVEFFIHKRAAILRWITAYNASGANTYFVQVHDFAPTPPIEGTNAEITPLPLAAQTTNSLDCGEEGCPFDRGIYVCASTTDTYKTIATSNDLFIYALWRPA